jgi:hypothetical protein
MGLISTIKSMLGIGGSRDRSRDGSGGTDVTVEREPDASSERAVKESDSAATDTDTAEDAGGRTDDTSDGSELTFENDPGETLDDGPADDDTASVDAGGDDAPDHEPGDGEPVEEIKGIGPAYAERLGDAGVHTVSDLAGADAGDLDEATGIGENRLQNWIDRAQAR